MFNFLKKRKIENLTADELGAQIARYSNDFTSIIQEKSGQELDYSIATLQLVEITLEEAYEKKEILSEDKKVWIVSRASAYISEIARKKFGGRYFWHPNLNQPVLIVGEPDFKITLCAFSKVKGRIENGIEDNIPFFFTGFMGNVENASEGDSKIIC